MAFAQDDDMVERFAPASASRAAAQLLTPSSVWVATTSQPCRRATVAISRNWLSTDFLSVLRGVTPAKSWSIGNESIGRTGGALRL